jgi:uncharacterized membrane protein
MQQQWAFSSPRVHPSSREKERVVREIKIEQSMIVDLPVEDVFAYVSNVENLTDWVGSVISVRKATPGDIRTGDVVRMTVRTLGRWSELTYEIIEYEPYHLITFKSISGIAPSVFSWQFEALERGQTRISQEAMMQIHNDGRFPGMAESTLAGMASRQIKHDLLILKDLLESCISSEAG